MYVYVISLPDAHERRNAIRRQLEKLGLEFEFIDARYGKDCIYDSTCYDGDKAVKFEGRPLTPGEVGCAVSHTHIYSLIAESKRPYALILEDDAKLSDDLPEVLKVLEKTIEQGALITLERCDVYKKKSAQTIWKNYCLVTPRFVKEGSIAQAAGYVITRKAAEAMQYVNKPVFFPADSWGYYIGKVSFYGIIPSMTLVRQNVSFGSSTQDGTRDEFKPNSVFRLWFYGFRTYNPVGMMLTRTIKKVIGR